MFFIFITTGESVSLVASGVSNHPYLSRKAPIAFMPSDSLDIRSDTAPTPAALIRLGAPSKAFAPPATPAPSPVAANALADSTVPAANVPKCTKPRNCLPHHVFVSIGLS